MKSILLTIDTEFYISQEEILGIKGENGIDEILKILDNYNIKATFFIDYFSIKKWGEEIFWIVNDKIKSRGHQIELHLHPYISGGLNYMWQYDYESQKNFIDSAIEYYKKFNQKSPELFRAGGYSADDSTIQILEEKKFKADLSFQYHQKRCKISSNIFPFVNRIAKINTLWEIPTTVYKYYFPFVRYNSINLEWCSLLELKEIIEQFKKSSVEHIVIMMHSFALLKRKDRKIVSKSNIRKKRLLKFLDFCIQSGLQFQMVNQFLRNNEDNLKNTEDFLPVIKKPNIILSGLFTKFLNFWTLKKSFRRKIIWGFSLIFLLILLFLYLAFFNYIEPSIHRFDPNKVDVRSWNEDKNINTLEEYFIVYRDKKIQPQKNIDKFGFTFRTPFRDKKKFVLPSGVDSFYVPTDMSLMILDYYNAYQLESDSSYIERILKNGEWLKNNAVKKNGYVVWQHPYKFSKYDIDFNWTGSWAMGNILSALSRVYQISMDTTYLELGKLATNAFNVPISEGGILAIDDAGDYWYEEYPEIPKNSVLNGFIEGLFGLYDFWRITKYPLAKELFNKGIKTLEKNIHLYDCGYWSYYDLRYSYVTDYFYHVLVHLPQLQVLYQITGKQIFNHYYFKWNAYLDEPYYSMFKCKIFLDAIHRRFTYKSFFTLGK